MINVAAGGTLMRKERDEAYELLEEWLQTTIITI